MASNNTRVDDNNPNILFALDPAAVAIRAAKDGGDTLQRVLGFAANLTVYAEMLQQSTSATGGGMGGGNDFQRQPQRLIQVPLASAERSNDRGGGPVNNENEEGGGGYEATPTQSIPKKRRVSDFKTEDLEETQPATCKREAAADPLDVPQGYTSSGPTGYTGRKLTDSRLEYSVGHKRKVLDLYWNQLGLSAPFGSNAVVSRDGPNVSHLSLKQNYSVLPFDGSYTLKLQMSLAPNIHHQAILLDPSRYKQSSVPVFWAPNKKKPHYHYVGHFRCVKHGFQAGPDGGSHPSSLELEFEHFDTVLDAKLAHIDPKYVKVKQEQK